MSKVPFVFGTVAEEDFEEFRRVCADGSAIPDYPIFADNAIKFAEKVIRRGGVAVKVYMKPAELAAWCRANGRSVDANARRDYALFRFNEMNRSDHE